MPFFRTEENVTFFGKNKCKRVYLIVKSNLNVGHTHTHVFRQARQQFAQAIKVKKRKSIETSRNNEHANHLIYRLSKFYTVLSMCVCVKEEENLAQNKCTQNKVRLLVCVYRKEVKEGLHGIKNNREIV